MQKPLSHPFSTLFQIPFNSFLFFLFETRRLTLVLTTNQAWFDAALCHCELQGTLHPLKTEPITLTEGHTKHRIFMGYLRKGKSFM